MEGGKCLSSDSSVAIRHHNRSRLKVYLLLRNTTIALIEASL
jgi:hypothetical protein